MRDQYKVLSERYEQIQENESLQDTYKLILKQILELSQPEDKDRFLELLKKYQSVVYSPISFTVQPRFIHYIESILTPDQPEGERTNEFETNVADRLYYALRAAGHVLDSLNNLNWPAKVTGLFRSKTDKETSQSRKESFERVFNIWCDKVKEYKAIQAAQTQHTQTHGVDLRDL